MPSYTQSDTSKPLPSNGIPVIEITTDDGTGIEDKKTWKQATIVLHGNGLFDDLTDTIQLKGRGNSSFSFAKRSFNIKFSSKRKMLGMKKSKKWVFLANYRDRSLLRNDITYHIAKFADNLEWTPSGEFVDLVFNGNYVGNYYVCEKINVNKQHVDIDEMTKEDVEGENLTGGYLLSFDRYYDEVNKFKTKLFQLPVGILSPDEDECMPQQIEYISKYLNEIENLLRIRDFTNLYNKYIDLPSFIDYYIVEVITGNNDFNSPLSVYTYKKRNGKLYAGPLWDFDFSTYDGVEGSLYTTSWWYKYLLQDEYFKSVLKERWNNLLPLIRADIFSYITNRKNYIFMSAIDNFKSVSYDPASNFNNLIDSGFLMSYDKINEFLDKRLTYLDNVVNSDFQIYE